jgi:hypothetical protein
MSGYSSLILLATATAAGTVASITTPRFDACSFLKVYVRLAGYSGAGIAQLQFNGDAGSTAYAWRVSNNNAATTTAVSGVATGLKVSQTATAGARALHMFDIRNIAGQVHGAIWQGSDLSESAATAPDISVGSGIWTNTSQITQITLTGDTVNILAGSEIQVFGLVGVG